MTLVLATALIAVTAVVVSWRIAEASVLQFLVGAYVLAFAEIVLVSLLLSFGDHLTKAAVLGSVAGIAVAALIVLRPRSALPWGRIGRAAAESMSDRANIAIAIAAGGVVCYSIALGLFTPPSTIDELWYHLTRAAFWAQQDAVGYVAGARDAHITGFPPNAEIAMAFTMITSGTARYSSLVQLSAALGAAVAVCGIARRVGLDRRASAYGALMFVTLPIVAVQMGTSLNDIVVASFVASAAFFLLRESRSNRLLAALSVALLIGTKLTGIIALPGLILIAVLANRRKPLPAVAAVTVGALAGSYWYVLNVYEVGEVTGGISGERVGFDPVAAVARGIRMGISFLELPGAVGLDRLLFVGAAVALLAVGFLRPGPVRRRAAWAAVGAGAIVSMLVLVSLNSLLVRGTQKVFFELGRADVGYLDANRSTTKVHPLFSFFGPVGVLLGIAALVLVIRAVRTGRLPSVAVALAVAPAIWLAVEALVLPYWESNGGRFTMAGVALAAATWGVVLPIRPLAWSAVAMAAITVTLSLVHLHDRASGLRLLEPARERSAWSLPDWAVQSTDHPDLGALYRFVDGHVPSDARISLEPIAWPSFSQVGPPPFPFFGRDLSRTVVFASTIAAARRANAEWAVLSDRELPDCIKDWRVAYRHDGWVALRRVSGVACGTESP